MALRFTRIQVNIPAQYFFKNYQAEGRIVDISSGGVALEVRQIIVINDLIRVKFKTYDSEVEFWGIVKNVSGSLVGLEFEELSNEMADRIGNYVNVLLKERGLSSKENF